MSKAKSKPKWASEYFTAALDNIERLRSVIETSGQGINAIPMILKLSKTLEISDDSIKRIESRADLAQKEIDRDFSTLYGFGVVSLWSWLESLVTDYVVLSIERRPSCLHSIKAPKVRIDLAEYARMRGKERAVFIADTIDRELGGPLRNGLGRFDALLTAIGVNVQIEDEHRRDIFELQQVRNCISHRFGIVDARFAAACPWMKPKIGKPLVVNRSNFIRYSAACSRYLLVLLYETGDLIGVDYRSAGEVAARKREQYSDQPLTQDGTDQSPNAN